MFVKARRAEEAAAREAAIANGEVLDDAEPEAVEAELNSTKFCCALSFMHLFRAQGEAASHAGQRREDGSLPGHAGYLLKICPSCAA